MSDINKRRNNEEINKKKSKSLVKLGVNSNERYDSYGHIIGEVNNNAQRSSYDRSAPGKRYEYAGDSSFNSKRYDGRSQQRNSDTNSVKRNSHNIPPVPRPERKSDNISKRKKAEDSASADLYKRNDLNRSSLRNSSGDISRRNSSKDKSSKKDAVKDKHTQEKYASKLFKNKEVSDNTSKRKISKFSDKEDSKKSQKSNKIKNKNVMTSSPHERRLNEKKPLKKKNIQRVLKVAAFILIIAIVVSLFWIGQKVNEDVRTNFLSTGNIESVCDAKVSVIRKETPLKADFKGRVVAQVNEGDRVSAGTVIAYVVKPEYESELVALRKVEDKITAAQDAASYVESEHTELSAINEQINSSIKALAMMSSDCSAFYDFSEQLQTLEALFETKNEIVMNAQTTDAYITELKTQREAILNNLNNYMKEVVSSVAGVVSFYTDNYGEEATAKSLQIEKYIDNKGQTENYLSESALYFSESNMKNMIGAEVSEDQVVAKITPDIKYYVSAIVPNEYASSFYSGKAVNVRTADKRFSVDGKVIEVANHSEKTYVLIESSSGISGAVSQRNIDAQIVINSASGLKVPKRALTEWDSAGLTARITILRSNYVSYVFVNVLAEDGEYAIISASNEFVSETDKGITSVRVNDMYVVNYELVTEGQIIGG